MKRKIFSKLLMVALVIAAVGSFVSCKDYDDDINNLQNQINKAALQSELAALQQTVANNATAAKAAADAAEAAAKKYADELAAKSTAKAADLEKLIAEVKAIADAAATQKALDEVKAIADAAATKDELSAVKAIADAAATQAALTEAIATLNGAIEKVKAVADAAATKDELDAAKKELTEAIGKVETAAAAAKKLAEDAQAAADKAQATADKANTDLAAEVKRAKEAEEKLDAAIKKALEDAKKYTDDALTASKKYTDDEVAAAAAKAADDLAKAIANVYTKAEVDKLIGDAKTAASADAAAKLAKALGDLGTASVKDYVNTEIGDAVEDLKEVLADTYLTKSDFEKITGVSGSLTASVNALYSAVTSISLYSSNRSIGRVYGHGATANSNIEFVQVQEQANKFPTDAKKAEADNQYTFTDGKYITYTDEVLVRVSPVSAVLTADMIELINSKGEAISSDLISVESVEPYTALLTRTASNNGLWKITFKLADGYTKADFDAVKEVVVNNVARTILYAVAVNNTKDDAADRRIVSEYDVTVNTAAAVHAGDFTVNDEPIANIHNRYTLSEVGTATGGIQEWVWKLNATGDYVAQTTPVVSNPAAATDNAVNRPTAVAPWNNALVDNRQAEPFLYVDIDEDIVIEYPDYNLAGNPTPLKGFYVTLDRAYAVESAPSEINAWDSYEYEGVGKLGVAATMFDGNTGTIKIKSASAKNDYIGFRVYAVNLDGTLVDPDGRSFYVYVGKEDSNAQSVSANVYATAINPTSEAAATIAFTVDPNTATEKIEYGAWEITNPAADFPYLAKPAITAITYLDAAGNAVPVGSPIGLPGTTTVGKFTTAEANAIKAIKVQFTNIAQVYDNQVVVFRSKAVKKVTVGGATTELPAGSITANITKLLPEFPAGVVAKVGQFTGSTNADQFSAGNYNCFLLSEIGETWGTDKHNAGDTGVKNLAQVFNIKDAELTALGLTPASLSFEFGTSAWNAATNSFSNKVTAIHGPADTYTLSVDKALIGTTDHASKAIYNYGAVSSYKEADGTVKAAQVHKPFKSFTTAYKCLWDTPTMTWKWVDANKKAKYQKPSDTAAKDYKNLFYNTAAEINLSAITGQNSYNPTLYGVKLDGLTGKFLGHDVDGTTTTYLRTAKIISKKSGNEDYYTAAFDNAANPTKVTLTPKSGTTNPEASESPVACQLILTFYDQFGHAINIALDIDMDRQ